MDGNSLRMDKNGGGMRDLADELGQIFGACVNIERYSSRTYTDFLKRKANYDKEYGIDLGSILFEIDADSSELKEIFNDFMVDICILERRISMKRMDIDKYNRIVSFYVPRGGWQDEVDDDIRKNLFGVYRYIWDKLGKIFLFFHQFSLHEFIRGARHESWIQNMSDTIMNFAHRITGIVRHFREHLLKIPFKGRLDMEDKEDGKISSEGGSSLSNLDSEVSLEEMPNILDLREARF